MQCNALQMHGTHLDAFCFLRGAYGPSTWTERRAEATLGRSAFLADPRRFRNRNARPTLGRTEPEKMDYAGGFRYDDACMLVGLEKTPELNGRAARVCLPTGPMSGPDRVPHRLSTHQRQPQKKPSSALFIM